eukprot:351150-Chlamydomonas_euryale.AAC.3
MPRSSSCAIASPPSRIACVAPATSKEKTRCVWPLPTPPLLVPPSPCSVPPPPPPMPSSNPKPWAPTANMRTPAGTCGSVAVWQYGSVAVWQCDSVAVRQCGSVAVWRRDSIAGGSVAMCQLGTVMCLSGTAAAAPASHPRRPHPGTPEPAHF